MADMIRALLLLALTLWAVECQEVSFSGESVTMVCPPGENEEAAKWTRPHDKDKLAEGDTLDNRITFKYDQGTSGFYKCSYTETKNYFYVHGKACKNCYELDATLLIGMIVGDLLVTGGVIIFIYNCAQRKAGASPPPSAAGRPRARNAPSVPDRDYEALNLGTRDTYAVAGMNRNG